MSKVFEKTIHEQLYEYLNNVLNELLATHIPHSMFCLNSVLEKRFRQFKHGGDGT